MVHCSQCRGHIPGSWDIGTKHYQLQLGVREVWLLSKSAGYASVYCKRCYEFAIRDYYNLRLKDSQSFMRKSYREVSRQPTEASTIEYEQTQALQRQINQLELELEDRDETIYEMEIEKRKQNEELDKLQRRIKSLERQARLDNSHDGSILDEKCDPRPLVDEASQVEIQRLKQEVFNGECERTKLEAQLNELNLSWTRRRFILDSTVEFEDVYEVVKALPIPISRMLAEQNREIKDVEAEIARKMESLTREIVKNYRNEVTSLVEAVKSKKKKELQVLQEIRDEFRRNALQSRLYTEEEIEAGLKPTLRKIKQKQTELDELTESDDRNSQNDSRWTNCVDDWVS